MDKHPICGLTGIELEYAFASAMGYSICGDKKGPFVLHSTAESAIYIFGSTKETISFSSFSTDFAEIPLEKGKELGATLYTEDGVAKCQLKGLSVEGEDYMQALMRALVMYFSTNQE